MSALPVVGRCLNVSLQRSSVSMCQVVALKRSSTQPLGPPSTVRGRCTLSKFVAALPGAELVPCQSSVGKDAESLMEAMSVVLEKLE